MSKKSLNTAQITEELSGAVAQFAHSQPPRAPRKEAASPAASTATSPQPSPTNKKRRNPASMTPRIRDTKQPRNHDTMQPSHRDTTNPSEEVPGEAIETVRAAVKQLGKEAATYRFTLEEKKSLADVVYTYKSAGLRTSENELTRIAVNWALDDYRRNGQLSVLATVLERLKA